MKLTLDSEFDEICAGRTISNGGGGRTREGFPLRFCLMPKWQLTIVRLSHMLRTKMTISLDIVSSRADTRGFHVGASSISTLLVRNNYQVVGKFRVIEWQSYSCQRARECDDIRRRA